MKVTVTNPNPLQINLSVNPSIYGSVGPQGPQGPAGPQGDPVTVLGYTLNDDGTTTVSFDDGSDVVLQRGARGLTGERGISGAVGPTGPQGYQGPSGPTGFTYRYRYTADERSAVESGYIRGNFSNGWQSTYLSISETTLNGSAMANALNAFDEGYVILRKADDPEIYLSFVYSAGTDYGDFRTIPTTYLGYNGTLDDEDIVYVEFYPRGIQGIQGLPSGGVPYTFDANSTVMAAPDNAGEFRFDNLTEGSATNIAIRKVNADGLDLTDYFTYLVNAGTSALIEITKENEPQNKFLYTITAVSINSTWVQLTVTPLANTGDLLNDDLCYINIVKQGVNGAAWYSDTGAPLVGTGVDGDWFFREDTSQLYRKESGTWNVKAQLTGPTGPTGPTGASIISGNGVPAGGTGSDNDHYIDLDNGDLYLKTTGVWSVVGNIEGPAAPQDGEPNGFVDYAGEVDLTWDNTNRRLTIAPKVSSFTFYSNGTKYVKTSSMTFDISTADGDHLIYFDDNGDLAEVLVFEPNIIQRWCFVAFVYWDSTAGEAVPDAIIETHGASMSSVTHSYLHNTQGTKYDSGLVVTVTAGGGGSLDAHAQFQGASGVIWDEDIRHNISTHAYADNLAKLYKDGASGVWKVDAADSYVVKTTGTGRAAWNEWTGATWQLTELTNNDFVLMHLFAIPGFTVKWAIVMGQADYV